MTTFHRRPLPDDLVALASSAGQARFAAALADGSMAGYFAVAEQFQTQAEPAYCGLTSLAVVLNSLGVDPGRAWKGPWRWYSEELLDCCVPLPVVRARGITFDELACLGRCNGARVVGHRADAHDEAALRAAIVAAARDPQAPRVIASYARAGLGQTGDGHFSPVAGYHAATDTVLLLDVAGFKYPPHWVPVPRLHAAMRAIDAATGKCRGWLLVQHAEAPPALLLELGCDEYGWADLAAAASAGREALDALAADVPISARAAAWLGAVAPVVAAVRWRAVADDDWVARQAAARAALAASRAAAIAVAARPEVDPAIGALVLLLAPAPPGSPLRDLAATLPPELVTEVSGLARQFEELARHHRAGDRTETAAAASRPAPEPP